MMPVNSKSIFTTLCQYMEKLDNDEVDVAKAGAMSKLTGQAVNYLNYELKRAVVMGNENYRKHHRSLELKEFDSLPQ